MPPATLTIRTDDGDRVIEFDDFDLESLDLSDSRARMKEALQKIAKALGISEDSDADAIVAELAKRPTLADIAKALGVEVEVTDADELVAKVKELKGSDDDGKTLEDRAKDEGKTLVDADTFNELKDQAAAGAAAADQLKADRFDRAFEKALTGGRVDAKSETKERFKKLYEADADTAIETLDNLPKVVNTKPAGSGEDSGEVPENQDADRAQLDREVRAFMADEDESDYRVALSKVLAKRGAAA